MIKDKHFEKLVQENAAILNKICRVYTNSEEDFDDYYQEVTIQLWSSFQNFRGESQVSTWVYRVAINTCLGLLRKEKYLKSKNQQEAALKSSIQNTTYQLGYQ